ncbi:MAG: hypothetical protein QOH92_1619 [Chloroflexota bacterium]|jgi:hypothetical protein|nr:hypothetical protein [Chloroflexota bacterium]
MRRKGLWLSTKSIFAPTDVAASLALIVLVGLFTMVYFGVRHTGATRASTVAADVTPTPQISVSPSAARDPVIARTPDTGLGTVIRAALATTRKRGTIPPGPSSLPSLGSTDATPSPNPYPTPSDTATPIPTPTPTDTPTPTPTDTPTPTPTDTPTPPPTPGPTDVVSPSPSPSI